ncbi:aspartyl protease family protein At5g10770-like [Phragmites australis]|uniref:aspartyl protease family protein At5g10770-like n=1 Tax=Phragmites australis TaxID=29695 RepID=UPI002D7874AB|nr:aspartyl protease family protein At5g10770-like [Phragmites australis]XP_062222178.1 aspartyl protease family protein At5g10770-like [Phragmites australis]
MAQPTTSHMLQHCLGRKKRSAMASVSKLLLLLLCSYHSLTAHARDDLSYKVLATGSVKPEAVCPEPKAVPSSAGATVPLHHRHGPCSPVNSTKMPTLEEMLRRDQLRAAYIRRKFSGAKAGAGDVQQSDATVPTTLGSSLQTLEYVITVGIGSPAVTQTMSIDTGSDVSWVQCKPCSQCHSQVDPLFDPSSSSTYSPFSCSSAACAQLGQEGNGCSSSQCQYIVRYGDGSSTTGTYSSDTLAFGSNAVKSFQFGCSQIESGLNDQTDGLMGLGGGAQSLVSQTASTFGSAFSYCLPPTPSSSGFLTLGAGTSGFVKTPMLRSSQLPTFYGVLLQAIMVGGKQLNVTTSVFSAGSIMDSGTIITRLPSTAYSALSSAFKDGMKQYPPAQPSGILDTCFDFNNQSSIRIPTVALVFSGGAVVNLDPNGIILGNCLAFADNGDDSSTGIIGNVQQRTFEVLYDVGGGAVGFRAGAC